MSTTLTSLHKLNKLSDEIYELQLRNDERLKAQHGRFNVFTTLLSASDEVRLHTRFLCALLDSSGSHDCGDLFLKLFFETLADNPPLGHAGEPSEITWSDYPTSDLPIGKEVRKPQGQLDLVLENRTHTLVIENKIYANEQDKQVARYIEYVETTNVAPENGQVLYLTLDGKQAETHNGMPYLRISYKEHILEWLERCLQATYNIIPINQSLIQYKSVVKQLTGQHLDSHTMSQIKDFLRSNPTIIRDHQLVSKAIDELRKETKAKLPAAFKEALKEDYSVELRPKMVSGGFKDDQFAGLVIRSKSNDITADHPFDVWLELNKWNNLCIGIETKWQKKRVLNQDEEHLLKEIQPELTERFAALGHSYNKPQQTFKGTDWYIGLFTIGRNFLSSDESFARMADHAGFERVINEIADAVRAYMEILEECYTSVKPTVTSPQTK